MIQVFGLGMTLFTVVGTLLPLRADAQTGRFASLDQQSVQYREAFENWMLLAIEGDAEAQFNLGLLYSEGKGVPVDYRQAAFWYRKGAEQGHTGAQYNLAHLYLDGRGIDKDPVKATYWWQQAAQHGHVLAQQYLGYAYYKGIGVNKDQQQALRWFREAARGGDWRAKKMLATIEQTFEPTPKLVDQQSAADESAVTNMPQPVPDRPDAPASEQAEHQAKTTQSAPAPAPADEQSAPQERVPAAFAPVPQPVRSKPLAPTAEQVDDQITVSRSQEPTTARTTGEPHTAPNEPKTDPMESGSDPQPSTQPSRLTTAAPADSQAMASRRPKSVTAKAPNVFGDAPPVVAQPDRQLAPNEYQADISTEPQPRVQATDSHPPPPDSETVSWLKLEQPLIDKKTAALERGGSTASAGPIAGNDRWLFAQPPDFYTLQLISAPRRATVDAFIRQQQLKNTRLLRTQVNGVRWWYLLSGSYPTREQARDASAASTVEQTSIWIRRFGALQENRCKNLSAAGLSAFCDGASVRASARGPQVRLDTDKRQAPTPEQSVASVEQPLVTAPVSPAASTKAQQTPTASMVAVELLAAAREKETAVADLRHDDNAWLFAQPEDHYTVQLISVPDVSQVARFLRDNKLQDKAVYYTTRRERRNWYFAIYGSHPDLDTAKQATKTLPLASGSVWIRRFDTIQKRQCRVANQLPADISDALDFYCRP